MSLWRRSCSSWRAKQLEQEPLLVVFCCCCSLCCAAVAASSWSLLFFSAVLFFLLSLKLSLLMLLLSFQKGPFFFFLWDNEGKKLVLEGFGLKEGGKGCYKLACTQKLATMRLKPLPVPEQGLQPTNQLGWHKLIPIGECFEMINFDSKVKGLEVLVL